MPELQREKLVKAMDAAVMNQTKMILIENKVKLFLFKRKGRP